MALRRLLSNIPTKPIPFHVIKPFPFPFTNPSHTLTTGSNPSQLDQTPDDTEYEYSGFITKGINGPILTTPTQTGFIFRLDMPGIRNQDLKVTVDGPKFNFSAQEPKTHRFGTGRCEPRYYEGQFELDPDVYNSGKYKAEVKNGVCWIEVPFMRVGPGAPTFGYFNLNIGRVKQECDSFGNVTQYGFDEETGWVLHKKIKLGKQ